MRNKYTKYTAAIFLGLILSSLDAFARGALWTLMPIGSTTQTIPASGTGTIQFSVQNNSSRTKILKIRSMAGITQSAPCVLSPNGTCTLTLSINGRELLSSGVHGGPILCDTSNTDNPNMNQCYQPSSTHQIHITKGTDEYYNIGGTISGLATSGLILDNNGTETLSISSGSTSFQFLTQIIQGGSYSVTVDTDPTGQTCTVSNASGTNILGNISNIGITCSDNSYTIAGSITGLTASGLVLKNNGSDDLSVSSGSTSFQFATSVAHGGSYTVTVGTQPTGQTCTVSNATGSNVQGNISNVAITCSTNTYTIGGSVSGLSANGLVLRNNGADDLSVSSGASSFQFSTPVAYGGSYSATIQTQPTGQTCSLSNGSGSNVQANISSISISCTSPLQSLTTLFSANDAASGMMFDVTNLTGTDIEVTGFDINTLSDGHATTSVWVITRSGTVDGYQSNSSGWTVNEQVDNVTNSGTNNATHFDLSTSITVPASSTIGFYIRTYASRQWNTSGASTTYSDSNLTITTFDAKDWNYTAPYVMGRTISGRRWNGTIYYR